MSIDTIKIKGIDKKSLVSKYIQSVSPLSKSIEKIGEGGFGSAYKFDTPNSTLPALVVKMQVVGDRNSSRFGKKKADAEIESLMALKYNRYDLGPKIYKADFIYIGSTLYLMLIMQPLLPIENLLIYGDIKILDIILDQVEKILDKFCDIGVVHSDFKWNNIMYTVENDRIKVTPIDFGMSCCFDRKIRCNLPLEYTKLLKDTFDLVEEGLSRKKLEYIYNRFFPKIPKPLRESLGTFRSFGDKKDAERYSEKLEKVYSSLRSIYNRQNRI